MDTERLKQLEDEHASGGTRRRPVVLVRARGARLWDAEGREYIDCAAGHGWANVGHCHPEVTRAIGEQAARFAAHTESSYNDQRALWFGELAEVLKTAAGESDRGLLTRFHPCNSGAEAIEGAIKAARFFTGRRNIVAAKGAFHGRTFGALSATWNPRYRKPFEPLVPGFVHVPYNDSAALAGAVGQETAAVLLEVVQGEGGVVPGDPETLRAAREICDRHGALLVIDEIQTGLGRTGAWLACERVGLAPDMLALGKSLGGGIPMGVVAWREGLGLLEGGIHGSTFGGNPLACAAGRAVIRILRDEKLPERAARLGDWLLTALRDADLRRARDVRGLGMMVGIELRGKVGPVLKRLMDRGVWALPAGPTVLRLLPPLTIEQEDLRTVVSAIVEALNTGAGD